jgi:hypothetical protein
MRPAGPRSSAFLAQTALASRRRSTAGVRAEASERLGDAARPVLHVDDDVVVAGESRELGESGGEGGGRGRRGCRPRRGGP